MECLRRAIQLALSIGLPLFGSWTIVGLADFKATPNIHVKWARVPTVAVMAVEPQTLQIPVTGYGTVRPKSQVQVVPQISGKLIYAHPNLAQGEIIAKGELLFEVEPLVFEARVEHAEAELRGLEATLARHDQGIANIDERIAIAEKMLAVDERNYLTSKRLLDEDRVGTQHGVALAYQMYLRKQDALVSLQSQRAMVPYLKLETQASLDGARARLLQAQYNLKNTKIFCPFSARVESASAYRSQMVTAHLSIATLTDIEAFEIPVGVNPRDLRWLDRSVQPHMLEQNAGRQGPDVRIRWFSSHQDTEWRGHVAQFERIDEATRTARMIVEVKHVETAARQDADRHDSALGVSVGMYCRAELPAEPLTNALLIPRRTIHDDRWVYVFEPATDGANQGLGRLGRREVSILRMIGDEVLVDYRGHDGPHRSQLESGEQLVVSRLADPVVGMQVALQKTSDTIPNGWDRPSPSTPAEFATTGREIARLAMSDSAGQVTSEE